jgi:hypothetical protein
MLFQDPPMARHRTQVAQPRHQRVVLRSRRGQLVARMGTAASAIPQERLLVLVAPLVPVVAQAAPMADGPAADGQGATGAAMVHAAARVAGERR